MIVFAAAMRMTLNQGASAPQLSVASLVCRVRVLHPHMEPPTINHEMDIQPLPVYLAPARIDPKEIEVKIRIMGRRDDSSVIEALIARQRLCAKQIYPGTLIAFTSRHHSLVVR